MINHVSDQLLEEWRVNRPDIVIADFITLSAGFVAEELEIPWITTMATQFAIETPYGPPCFFGGMGVARTKKEEKIQALCRKLTRIGKYCGAFPLTQTLKTLQFQVVTIKMEGDHLLSLCHLWNWDDGARVEDTLPHQYAWLGPFGNFS